MAEKLALMRDAYGETLVELGRRNNNIVVLDADLSPSTKTSLFAKEFPERFFDVGVAEANMISIAAGLASVGKIAFASTFAVFGVEKGLNQFKQSVAYPNLNVKLVTTHGGISVGEDGSSHFCIEDLAVMRSLPNVTVIVPADAVETRVATRAIAEHFGPVFMRLSRPKTPLVYDDGYRFMGKELKFEIGKSITLREGRDVTILATGLMVAESLLAVQELAKEGIDAGVINFHTIKPIDREAILRAATSTGALVTAEEHNVIGGLGGAVAEVLVEENPVPMVRVGIQDTYAESGPWRELFAKYGLTSSDIVKAVKKVLKRRGR
ncbi:MAG: transketolase [Candidatus Hadarchaeum yellowstonense]|jgi:transketolase|uniref:Transketolase n=1 Tax=Hadarchaeum yellowstonense TaxID=1776334 RepID=A0A147JU89_HADYE|nr:MAG: transketolase [Candidatus Hadarchaeum yellowstonense]